ncbi:hypothetical protein [Haladaptatus sp. T7]|uniref:hypothetical protein n=1 Tax=Haladaptatus sp. T7 TaxID=2029368 RepID=UPI0021A254D2|nr:hypothetical protein [Haladaptatus sp. T7]GKZ16071.1 hypothetical protein HAL_39520 [Haladaptatus sp. T7]
MSDTIKALEEIDPIDLSIQFEGTELLAIQYLLGGQNSSYGFKFDLLSLDKADFSGSRDEEMLKNKLVRDAEQTGDLRKVTFYVPLDERSEMRAVQLNFYEDGHTTSSAEVTPNEYDQFVNAIYTAEKYSDYMTSLDELLNKYVYNISLDAEKEMKKTDVIGEFTEISTTKLGVSNDDVLGRYMHNMVLANIGIEIYKIVTEEDKYEVEHEVSEIWDGNIANFFKRYAQHNIPQSADQDYQVVALNINRLITKWQDSEDYQSPGNAISLLEFFVEDYDLQL